MRALVAEHHRYGSPLRVGSHAVARELLDRGFRVVWLAHPRSWPHRLFGRLPPEEVLHEDGVLEVTLRSPLPYLRLPLLDSVTWGRHWLRATPASRRRLHRLAAAGCELFWVSDFTCLGLLDALPCRRVVMRFFDRLDAYPWMPRSIYRLVRRYRDRADLALASSREVRRRLEREGIESRYLPNGVDLARHPRALALGEERERRVVYVGAVAPWFDHAAVELWAERLPGVEFVIYGPGKAGARRDLPNLLFRGPVAPERVPELLARARVGIIPFRRTPVTAGAHPLKLYEYLAAGCPVVSAALPEVAPVAGAVATYESAEEGLAKLEEALERPVDRGRLYALAEAASWSRRLDPVFAELGLEPAEGTA